MFSVATSLWFRSCTLIPCMVFVGLLSLSPDASAELTFDECQFTGDFVLTVAQGRDNGVSLFTVRRRVQSLVDKEAARQGLTGQVIPQLYLTLLEQVYAHPDKTPHALALGAIVDCGTVVEAQRQGKLRQYFPRSR